MKKGEMAAACSSHGGIERSIHNFGLKIWKKQTSWKT